MLLDWVPSFTVPSVRPLRRVRPAKRLGSVQAFSSDMLAGKQPTASSCAPPRPTATTSPPPFRSSLASKGEKLSWPGGSHGHRIWRDLASCEREPASSRRHNRSDVDAPPWLDSSGMSSCSHPKALAAAV